MYDVNSELVSKAVSDIREKMDIYESQGSLRGSLAAQKQKENVFQANSLEECVKVINYQTNLLNTVLYSSVFDSKPNKNH